MWWCRDKKTDPLFTSPVRYQLVEQANGICRVDMWLDGSMGGWLHCGEFPSREDATYGMRRMVEGKHTGGFPKTYLFDDQGKPYTPPQQQEAKPE